MPLAYYCPSSDLMSMSVLSSRSDGSGDGTRHGNLGACGKMLVKTQSLLRERASAAQLCLPMTWKTLSNVKLCKEKETTEQVSKIAIIGRARFEAVDNCGVV